MRRFILYIYIVVVSLVGVSCSVDPADFGFEGVVMVDDTDPSRVRVVLDLRNGSSEDLVVRRGEIAVRMKGDDLITLLLDEEVRVEASNEVERVETLWRVRRDDPATLYAMGRHSIERYIDRLSFGYDFTISGLGRRERRFVRRRVQASQLDIDFEKLLR